MSGVGGSLAAYGTFMGICGSNQCGDDVGKAIGGAVAGLSANVVATSLLTAGTGALLGGRGTVGSAFLGAVVGLGAGAAAAPAGSDVGLIVGVIIMPFVAPLFYEISSSSHAREMKLRLGRTAIAPSVAPIARDGRWAGGVLGLEGGF